VEEQSAPLDWKQNRSRRDGRRRVTVSIAARPPPPPWDAIDPTATAKSMAAPRNTGLSICLTSTPRKQRRTRREEFVRRRFISMYLISSLMTLSQPMEQIFSSEADSHLAGPEIPHLLWNSKVCYRFHNGPPLNPILNHINPDHTLAP